VQRFAAACISQLASTITKETVSASGCATVQAVAMCKKRTQNPPRATSWGFDPPFRHQQNKGFKLNWPLEIGEAKIVWWLFDGCWVLQRGTANEKLRVGPRDQRAHRPVGGSRATSHLSGKPTSAFKGAWQALGTLVPERLSALRRVATIESIGSSTRIEGSKLSDREVERLLSNLEIKSFATRRRAGSRRLRRNDGAALPILGRDRAHRKPRQATASRFAPIQRKRRASSRQLQDPTEQRCRVRRGRKTGRNCVRNSVSF
jgi:hypothetical protein